MAEDDIVENRLGDTQRHQHLSIHICTLSKQSFTELFIAALLPGPGPGSSAKTYEKIPQFEETITGTILNYLHTVNTIFKELFITSLLPGPGPGKNSAICGNISALIFKWYVQVD